ncbi:MAG: hypothetical protein DRG59_00285 [Deltaproteobacteria bacterium]|nr:MAG: hypothetical protein DRG83_00780 [Deltaproteobacteria bacterium]RLB10139.1 MAG: hypothetical protein DRG59_00285 [Deltaproteobacteria bacterium]HEC31037.1 PTS sugar transporter subunit IIA [Deltaproteobacteria bacterium]
MVGILVICHSNLAQELVSTAELIVGKLDQCLAISMDTKHTIEELKEIVASHLKRVDDGDGVLILTDLFGGTPSNISISFLQKGKVEVISGVNLPMLIKLASTRKGKSLEEIAPIIKEYGQRNISLASELMPLKKTKKSSRK